MVVNSGFLSITLVVAVAVVATLAAADHIVENSGPVIDQTYIIPKTTNDQSGLYFVIDSFDLDTSDICGETFLQIGTNDNLIRFCTSQSSADRLKWYNVSSQYLSESTDRKVFYFSQGAYRDVSVYFHSGLAARSTNFSLWYFSDQSCSRFMNDGVSCQSSGGGGECVYFPANSTSGDPSLCVPKVKILEATNSRAALLINGATVSPLSTIPVPLEGKIVDGTVFKNFFQETTSIVSSETIWSSNLNGGIFVSFPIMDIGTEDVAACSNDYVQIVSVDNSSVSICGGATAANFTVQDNSTSVRNVTRDHVFFFPGAFIDIRFISSSRSSAFVLWYFSDNCSSSCGQGMCSVNPCPGDNYCWGYAPSFNQILHAVGQGNCLGLKKSFVEPPFHVQTIQVSDIPPPKIQGRRTGATILVVTGAVALGFSIAGAAFCLIRKRRQQQKQQNGYHLPQVVMTDDPSKTSTQNF